MLRRALPLALLFACNSQKTFETGWPAPDTGDPADDVDADDDGWTVGEGDCDDANEAVNPGRYEIPCDGVDNDCVDGDEADQDDDGHLCEDVGGDDCDDLESAINPSSTDECGDGVDVNCDGDAECDCDGDGYDGAQCDGEDCDDSDEDANPGASDVCYDGFDSDCSGNDDDDCDGDGHASNEHGGDDCEDADPTISPSEPEACLDEVDNDCDGETSDCDCDGDGADGALGSCGGTDCDDEEATVYPGIAEDLADGLDNDCDGTVDEDGYCNALFPTTNGPSATRVYESLGPDGNSYTETMNIASWDTGSGRATLERTYSGSSGSYDVVQNIVCDEDGISTTSWSLASSLYSLDAAFTSPRVDLLPEDELLEGASWDFSYDAEDSLLGTAWTAEGTMTVQGWDTLSVTAGTFDVLVIEADYSLVDYTGLLDMGRDGTVVYYYAEYLGLVYTVDIDDGGSIVEERELQSYTGFFPEI